METRFVIPPPSAPTVGLFRLFTKESLTKIERRIQEERAAKRVHETDGTGATTTHDDRDEGPEPNPLLEAGSKLPAKMAGEFPPELFGKPIEDVDEFYHNKYVSIIGPHREHCSDAADCYRCRT